MASKKVKATKDPKPHLSLYVWTDFCRDYTAGLAFAIAMSEREARRLVVKDYGIAISRAEDWGCLNVYPLNQPIARAVSGGG